MRLSDGEMVMSKVLITGVDGFTGRYLAKALADQGHEVVGIAHNEFPTPIESASSCHICDLNDAQGLNDILLNVRPDKVAHLAAIASVSHGVVEDIYRTNVVGSRNLLEAIVAAGSADAVLLASSANIYGNRVSGAIDETVSPDPINDYAVSKLAMELVARLYQERLPIIIARPFNYTGVGQSTNFVIPKIIDHVRRGAKNIELGNLDVARDFSDVRDVVLTYVALLQNSDSIGQVFNICSGKAYSLRDVIKMIKEISGCNFEVTVNPAFVRQGEVEMLWGNSNKIKSIIGVKANYFLEDTLNWMIK